MGWGGQGGCERRIEVIVKMKKVRGFEGGVGCEGQCGCEIEVIVKMKKKIGGGPVRGRGQGGCERRIEIIVKMKEKVEGGREVRLDVNTKN